MAQIHTLKKEGNTIYPQTHVKAVVDDNGNTVDDLLTLSAIKTKQQTETTATIAPNIQANKTYQVSIINNLGVIGEFGNE